MADRTQAPTWNYETVHFEIDVRFDDHADAVAAALSRLVGHMERGRPDAWSIADMGTRHATLARAIVAFRARVTATHAKFKLGQNERTDVRSDILSGLARTGQWPLLEAMKRANPDPSQIPSVPRVRRRSGIHSDAFHEAQGD